MANLQIAFPFGYDGHGRTALATHAEHVRQMIDQLLFTDLGERVNRPQFGCGLRRRVFEGNSDMLAGAIASDAMGQLHSWLGDLIEIRDLSVQNNDNKLVVSLTYALQRTGEVRI